jgi:hypothetical protein
MMMTMMIATCIIPRLGLTLSFEPNKVGFLPDDGDKFQSLVSETSCFNQSS